MFARAWRAVKAETFCTARYATSAEPVSLAMSPALLGKYLEAARRVASHLVLKPDGLAFAPHPVVAEFVRRKSSDCDRWLRGMQRLQDQLEAEP